jgi:thiol-disulfide isomerase/thioredoxin
MNKWLAGVLVIFMCSNGAAADNYPPSAPIFAATLDNLEGKPLPLADFRGKPLVLNFWATWCPPCRKEIPELIEFHKRHVSRGVTLIGITVEDQARVAEFVAATPIPFPVLVGRDKGIALLQALGNQSAGLPYTVVLDRQGNIVFIKRGALTRERLEQVIAPLL